MLVVYYQGNRHEYFEEKSLDLVKSFRGKVHTAFSFSNSQWSAVVKFNTEEQELNYRDHVRDLGKSLNVQVTFGGYVEV